MGNWLTEEVNKHLHPDQTVLDLCCGNGQVSDGLVYGEIVGVDICKEYLDMYNESVSGSSVIQFDLKQISSSKEKVFADNSFDVVLCLDGVEHLEQQDGEKLVERIEKIANKKVIIFTPENAENPHMPVLNFPVNTWGITAGDKWQVHKSAFPRTYFSSRGYECIQLGYHPNSHDNSHYFEMLYIMDKEG
tara:strand:- start:449 stop:1018 length:570 start_codon:yes stop_codon:yes gene_type:complete